jgi:hypothetical protein
MKRWFQTTILLVLSVLLGASRCAADEGMDLEALRRDVAPPFDYALYCDVQGRLTGGTSDVLLVHRSAHLERVYADAQRGDPRAQTVMRQLDSQVQATGVVLADQALGLVCTSLPTCTVRWQFLDELIPSHDAGGMHVRQVLATSFAQEARVKQVQNAAVTAALSVLMVGGVVEKAEVAAAVKEASALTAGAAVLAEGGLAEEAAALQARLAEAEALETGARHPARLETLARYRPSLGQPPSGVALGDGRWADYVSYWERRYEEMAGRRPLPKGESAAKPPLVWDEYNSFLSRCQKGLEFQRDMARALKLDAGLPQAQRQWLSGVEQPLVAENVGLAHEGTTDLTYVDGLVVDTESLLPGRKPVVHSFSVKQHDFTHSSSVEARQQLRIDAREALTKYGGAVEVRRPGHPLFGRKTEITRVHLIYDKAGVVGTGLQKPLATLAQQLKVELYFYDQKK